MLVILNRCGIVLSEAYKNTFEVIFISKGFQCGGVVVDNQYNDGGFYCYFDDGTESGNSHIDIYRYFDGSFEAFEVMCGIIAIFEKYKEKLKCLQDTYKIKNAKETEDK